MCTGDSGSQPIPLFTILVAQYVNFHEIRENSQRLDKINKL